MINRVRRQSLHRLLNGEGRLDRLRAAEVRASLAGRAAADGDSELARLKPAVTILVDQRHHLRRDCERDSLLLSWFEPDTMETL